MKEEVRSTLTEPFPDAAIRTRRGGHGKELRYLETWRCIERLNQAFDHDWSFRIIEWRLLDSEVVVHGELEAGGITKQAFGSSQVTRSRESGEVVSIGDDVKAAASDALKKAATLLGIGLELYAGKSEQTATAKTPTKAPSRSRNGKNGVGEGTDQGSTPSNGSRITERQLAAVLSLAESRGGGAVTVRTQVLDQFGVPLEQLDRRQASQVISALNNGGIGVGGSS
jgi:hypothetical protein